VGWRSQRGRVGGRLGTMRDENEPQKEGRKPVVFGLSYIITLADITQTIFYLFVTHSRHQFYFSYLLVKIKIKEENTTEANIKLLFDRGFIYLSGR
jgi:hypothetical protein